VHNSYGIIKKRIINNISQRADQPLAGIINYHTPMQKNKTLTKLTLCFLTITLSIIFSFNFAFAQGLPAGETPDINPVSGQVTLRNPLGDTTDMYAFIGRLIRNTLGVVGSVALVMFVVGGLIWMTSGGNEQRIKKGKDILTWATMGLIIIFTSYAIIRFVFDILLND